jgi:MFS family permease
MRANFSEPEIIKAYTRGRKYGIVDLDKGARANLSSNIVSTLQAGCFAGSLIGSYVADKLGRKPGQLLCAIIALIGCVLQAASAGHLVALYFGRFIAGLGTGGASMMAPVYISENSPRAIRGAVTGLYQLFIVVGIMLSYWINVGPLSYMEMHKELTFYLVRLSSSSQGRCPMGCGSRNAINSPIPSLRHYVIL